MPEVYIGGGEATFEDGRDALVALLDALKTAMVGSYDPLFSFVYERHNVAALRLNAVSVSLLNAESVSPLYSKPATQGVAGWLLRFSLRVHTAYQGGIFDDQKTARLMNSIVNKLWANKTPAAGYYIDQISSATNSVQFAESATIGGEIIVTVQRNVCYTLE